MTEVATGDIPLNWDVFVTPSIPTVTSDLPPGMKQRDVVADIGDSHLRQAGRRPRRRLPHHRAGRRPGGLGRGERQEPDDDQRTRLVTLTNQGREALPLWEEAQTHIVSWLRCERWNMLLPDLSDVVSLACDPYIFLP
jgi:hypothetical protein